MFAHITKAIAHVWKTQRSPFTLLSRNSIMPYTTPDFSRDVEKVILMLSQALISPLAIFINSELLRISLWKNLRFLGA
ncbi:MAG: hypothetical protein V7L26_30450 [Nostoc sp.]|uniref:hypothetical protein n=1 Tax=Nostoc sp. TaxID=1180 RepID=UPI002FF5DCC2